MRDEEARYEREEAKLYREIADSDCLERIARSLEQLVIAVTLIGPPGRQIRPQRRIKRDATDQHS
jgi:hypothetical protein